MVIDRYSAHCKAIQLLESKYPKWCLVEWLPPYAPDLNPVEEIWNHSKYSDLANFIPNDISDLHNKIKGSLRGQSKNQILLRSYFKYAGLKL